MTDFQLTNGVKRSERSRAPKAKETQRVLFTGLDCPPGTRDLLPDLDGPAPEAKLWYVVYRDPRRFGGGAAISLPHSMEPEAFPTPEAAWAEADRLGYDPDVLELTDVKP